MEVNQSIREYILMGHSYEEAKELSAYEIALKEQLKNQKINMRERPIKMARVIHKQGISITCKDHLGNVFPSLKAMTKHYGVSVYTYQSRLRKGWSKERALTTAVKSRQVVDHLGNKFKKLKEMLGFYHISEDAYYCRFYAGWPLEKILTTPYKPKNKDTK